MLNRLGVRQKLGLLVLLPLAAVVCTIIPFAVERVDAARGDAATAAIATSARQTGWLVQDLQRERLASVAYLTLSTVDKFEVLRRYNAVDSDPAPAGLDRTGLAALRQRILNRSVDASVVYRTYDATILGLLDGMQLSQPAGVDATGLLELTNLDTTLRANEAASRLGAALVITTGRDAAGPALLAAALIEGQQEEARLVRSGTPQQRTGWNAVVSGPSERRLQGLASLWSSAARTPSPADVVTALAAAQSADALRQSWADGLAADIVSQSNTRAGRSQLAAALVGGTAGAILLLISVLSVRVSRSVASPLRRLTRAASAVADLAGAELIRVADEDNIGDPARLAAVDLRSEDEVGELAAAFNRVQATAALLLERQVTMRRNVAVMFANIGRRTQSLVARQLAVIDDMERDEQDALLLERLYRLDHLATRLRRSADSLLVVAGIQDDGQSSPTPLVDVVRGAMGEIAGFQAIRLGAVPTVVIAADLAIDLRLILAELLENATSFSPPGAAVEVGASLQQSVYLRIVDHGIGMTEVRLAEENQRMVERQRLDVVPTQVLGLFVVGRLARRHALEVKLDPTPSQGVTVTITVPPTLFAVAVGHERAIAAASTVGDGQRVPARPPAHRVVDAGARSHAQVDVAPNDNHTFRWLAGASQRPAAFAAAEPWAGDLRPMHPGPDAGPEPAVASRNGLTQRRPGHHFPSRTSPTPPVREPSRARDAQAEADQLDAFTQGSAAADAALRGNGGQSTGPQYPSSGHPARGGLTRRVPGEHLAESVRTMPPRHAPAATADRDGEAERDALNSYLNGLAQAQRMTEHDYEGRRR